MEPIDEPPDPFRRIQDYTRILLERTFPNDLELVRSLDLGGVNGSSIESRARFTLPADLKHFNTFCLPYLRGIATQLQQQDKPSTFKAPIALDDFLNGPLNDALKLFYSYKYPAFVRYWFYEI